LWLEDQRLGAALKKILDEDAPLSRQAVLNGPQSLVSQWARAAVMWRIDENAMVQAFAFSWLENACLACAKLLPMGQRQVHHVMNHMFDVINEAEIPAFVEDQWGPSLPGLAMLSSQHEHQQNRLFLS
jgi:urease accessory protein